MEIKNKEEYKNKAYKLADTLYLISLIINTIDVNLASLHSQDNHNTKAILLYDSLVRLHGLDNISESLEIVKERIEESANYFLDEVDYDAE